MSRVRVAIAVADDALNQLPEIVELCRSLGFRPDSTLTGVGIFTGSVEADALEALRKLPGVAAVELERDTRIHRPPRPSN